MDLAPVVAKEVELDEIRSRRAANGFSIALPAVAGYSESENVAMVFPKISRCVLLSPSIPSRELIRSFPRDRVNHSW